MNDFRRAGRITKPHRVAVRQDSVVSERSRTDVFAERGLYPPEVSRVFEARRGDTEACRDLTGILSDLVDPQPESANWDNWTNWDNWDNWDNWTNY